MRYVSLAPSPSTAELPTEPTATRLAAPSASPDTGSTGSSGRSPALHTAVLVHAALALALLHALYHYRVSKRSWFQKHRAFFLDRDKVAHVRVTPLLEILVSIDAADDADHMDQHLPIQTRPALRTWSLPHPRRSGATSGSSPDRIWGGHPRPTSRPARCPRMMGLVGWCGSNATIGNKGICQLASSDRGQDYYSNSMSSTTATSVHYTCDPSSVFPAWHWRFPSPERSDHW